MEARRGSTMRVIALMYHDVVSVGAEDHSGFPGPDAALYKLAPATFEDHLDAIASAATTQPATVFQLSAPLHSPALVLTFDDGGVSARGAADALERRGWRGHFFVTAGFLGRPGFLGAGDVRDLHRRGHVIGSHSYSHPWRMARCRGADLLDEWRRSVAILEDVVGQPIVTASIPGGAYSTAVARAAADAGIAVLFSSEPTQKSRSVAETVVLGRYTIQRWCSPRVVAALVRGDRRRRVEHWLLWNAKKLTKALGGESYLRARELILRRMASAVRENV